MMNQMGVQTGVDLDALLEVADWVQGVVGHPLPSNGLRAYLGRKAAAEGKDCAMPA